MALSIDPIVEINEASTCRFCKETGLGVSEDPEVLPGGSRVLPTVGALLPMWCLVLAPRHVTATANLTDQERRTLFEDVEWLARQMPGDRVTAFEHGASDDESIVACTTAHAHVHVLPTDFDVRVLADDSLPIDGEWRQVDVNGLADCQGSDYLLLGVPGSLSVKHLVQPTSQYFRRVIAYWNGNPEIWDWRSLPTFDPEYDRTLRFLRELSD